MEHKRMAGWWIRWEDLNWPSPDAVERVKTRAAKYAEANVTDAVVFGTHFRWDWMPYFELLHDYLAAVAEELHSYGIRFIDHHSVNLVHRYNTREEMRHVMLHSGPHLPFSPSYEAAKTWEWKGKKLNDWRVIDVRTGKPHYYEQYASEGFCHRNPEFVEAYLDYAKKLIADTKIDGLMADDTVYYGRITTCGCPYCRAELKRRSGIDLPPVEDQTFWGNWDNPAWKHWLDLRLDACGDFQEKLRGVVPEGFDMMSCGAGGANAGAALFGSDPRQFLRGCNYTNLEFSGNTPPYKHDPVTVNSSIGSRLINASHHQAAAREKGAGAFGTGYGFTEDTANIIWATNKTLGADCWFSTLKDRLGLPEHILKTLPDEPDVIGKAFTYEKEHPDLFGGEQVSRAAVFFSYETRNHTCFGSREKGYSHDYAATLKLLFSRGISIHTVFQFPKDPAEYSVVLVPSPYSMTEKEKADLAAYLEKGGKAIITGPSAVPGCDSPWTFANRPDCEPLAFFPSIRDGVWAEPAAWQKEALPDTNGDDAWQHPAEGLWYHPFRISSGKLDDAVIERTLEFAKPLPVDVLENEGYYVSMLEDEKGITVHFLAADYDTDIDHHLDEIRFHRSRMNYVNKVEPIGVGDRLRLRTCLPLKAYSPFTEKPLTVTRENDLVSVLLPERSSYVLIRLEK